MILMYLGSIHQCTCISFIFKKKLKNKFRKKFEKRNRLGGSIKFDCSDGFESRRAYANLRFFSIPYCTLLGGLLSPKTPLSWEGF